MTTPKPISTSSIVSQAFRFCEMSPISSLADDTEEAQAAADQYPRALGMVLAGYDWSFARRLVDLPEVADLPAGRSPDPDLEHAYKLPGDCLKLRLVQKNTKFRVDDGYLFCDRETNVLIRYTRRIDNENKLPDLVQTAVSLQLAVLLCPKFVGSRSKRSDLKQELSEALFEAKGRDVYSASDDSWDGIEGGGDWVAEVTR